MPYPEDRQQEEPHARCCFCGGEIYPGEHCYKIGYSYYCDLCVSELTAGDE